MTPLLRSFVRFYSVGAMGVGIQLLVLTVLRAFEFPVLVATAIAVEAAVVHNFLWHERWTWAHRSLQWNGVFWRLLRFNMGNGLVSLAGNLAIMWMLVAKLHAPDLPSNIGAIGVCSFVNFLISDRWVFQS